MSDETLIFLKPSALKHGLVGEVLSRFERKGLRFKALKLMKMTRETAEELYSIHRGKHFFQELIETVSNKYVVAAILSGRDAVAVVRTLIGATDPVKASPGTIRGDYGLDITDNIIHASDSKESFEREVKILFPEYLG